LGIYLHQEGGSHQPEPFQDEYSSCQGQIAGHV